MLRLAEEAAPVPQVAPSPSPPPTAGPPVRIAWARDEAFGFYYADDLAALERAGAELVPFSPLRDEHLPAADGLLIGGGFPETHLERLAANRALATEIAAFIEAGGPAYAECGGLMYLARRLTWGEKQGKMVGVIPADVVMHERPQGRGYVRLAETAHHPWPLGGEIAAHEFHYSALENIGPGVEFAYRVVRGYGIDGRHDGIRYRNLLASYTHQRDTGRNHWAARFVDFVRRQRG